MIPLRLSLPLAALAAALAFVPSRAVDAAGIRADGSSTVYPITREAARRHGRRNAGTEIEVKFSGTTAGFRRFCAGETDIANASRPINGEELAICAAAGVRFVELPIAFDALAVVVHPDNGWAERMTVEELKSIWEPAAAGRITRWRDVRPDWPDAPIGLYGRGQDSGTYDYFTETIVGQARASRMDYTASENEETLAAAIAADPNALGFFGVGAYFRHWEDLKTVAVDAGDGPAYPSLDAVRAGRYSPLARPLFLYVDADGLKRRPDLAAFVGGYLAGLRDWVHFTGYMPLGEATYRRVLDRFEARREGSAFDGRLMVGSRLDDVLRRPWTGRDLTDPGPSRPRSVRTPSRPRD